MFASEDGVGMGRSLSVSKTPSSRASMAKATKSNSQAVRRGMRARQNVVKTKPLTRTVTRFRNKAGAAYLDVFKSNDVGGPELEMRKLLSSSLAQASKSAEETDRALRDDLCKYTEIYQELEADWDAEQPLNEVLAEPVEDAPRVGELFKRWRETYMEQAIDLDKHLPMPTLRAESLKQEVEDLPTLSCGHKSMKSFVLTSLMRRRDTVLQQRQIAAARMPSLVMRMQQSSHSQSRKDLSSGGSGDEGDRIRALEAALENSTQLMAMESTALDRRIEVIDGIPEFQGLVSSASWTQGLVVLLRHMTTEDAASKLTRKLQHRLQYLNLTHRGKIWRRALELQSVMQLVKDEGPSAPPVPSGFANRKRMEAVLPELGATFGCSVSLTTDRGKTFAHAVMMSFPDYFYQQQAMFEFRNYPGAAFGLDKTAGNTKDGEKSAGPHGPNGLRHSNSGGSDCQFGENEEEGAALPELNGSNQQGEIYLKPSPWAARCPWEPHLDPTIEEQSVLIKTSYTASTTPARTSRREPSYAHDLIEDVLEDLKTPASTAVVGPHDKNIDGILHAEWCALKVTDATIASQRLHEVVDRSVAHSQTEAVNNGRSTDSAEAPPTVLPPPLQRGYYMLRHLQCRAHRWRLLCALNFYRFLQRRLTVDAERGLFSSKHMGKNPFGEEEEGDHNLSSDTHRTATSGDKGHSTSNMQKGERYWELSPRSLIHISKTCPLPFSPGENDDMDEDAAGLGDRETFLISSEPGRIADIISDDDLSRLTVFDSAGRQVVHAAAIEDLSALEMEMLSIGSYFIHKYEAPPSAEEPEKMLADRNSVLLDLYNAEVDYNSKKVQLLEVYLEMYEHASDPVEMSDLAQRIIDVAASRPRLDLEDSYFTDSYAAALCTLSSRTKLLQTMLAHQIRLETTLSKAGAAAAAASAQASLLLRATISESVPEEPSQTFSMSGRPSIGSKERIRPSSLLIPISATPMDHPAEESPRGRPNGLTAPEDDGISSPMGSPLSVGFPDSPRGAVTGLTLTPQLVRRRAEESEVTNPVLAHPAEGFGHGCPEQSKPSELVRVAPRGELVGPAQFCMTTAMVWKTELIMEEVYTNIVEHLHPSCAVLVTLIERACYMLALEMWREISEAEDSKQRIANMTGPLVPKLGGSGSVSSLTTAATIQPFEDAEFLVVLARETTVLLSSASAKQLHSSSGRSNAEPGGGGPGGGAEDDDLRTKSRTSDNSHEKSQQQSAPDFGDVHPFIQARGGLNIGGLLQYGFADIRRKVGHNMVGMFGYMLTNIVEHVHLRRRLQETVGEVVSLEKQLRAQASAFGTRCEVLRPVPVVEDEVVPETSSASSSSAQTPLLQGSGSLSGPPGMHNEWLEAPGAMLTAASIDVSLGSYDLASVRGLSLNSCSPHRVREFRLLLQAEVSYRNILLMCVHQNCLMMDSQTRHKELFDVNAIGPSREISSSDAIMPTMKRLRETVELSSSPGGGGETTSGGGFRRFKGEFGGNSKNSSSSSAVVDVSRYAHFFQTPAKPLNDLFGEIRRAMQSRVHVTKIRASETERFVRQLHCNLLTCSSVTMARLACELSVRTQAMATAHQLRSLTSIIPSRLSPFGQMAERKVLMLDKDKQVGNVFNIPHALDIVQLKSLSGDMGLGLVFRAVFDETFPPTDPRRTGNLRPNLPKEESTSGRMYPAIEVDYGGACSALLFLLHEMGVLVSLRTILATVDGDAITMLRMRRSVRLKRAGLEAGQETVGSTLSRTEPTYEAFEEMCSDLAQVAHRLDAMGDAARSASKVLGVLHSEVRSTYRQLALLLRKASRVMLESGNTTEALEVKRWSGLVEADWVSKSTQVQGARAAAQNRAAPPVARPLGAHPLFLTASPLTAALGDFSKAPPWPWRPSCIELASSDREQVEKLSLCQDSSRYVALLRPELGEEKMQFPRFLAKLLSWYGPCVAALPDKGEGLPEVDAIEPGPLPPYSSLPRWRFPPIRFSDMEGLVARLPLKPRMQLAQLRGKLCERRIAFRESRNAPSRSEEATNADGLLFGTLFVQELLREQVMALLRIRPPPMSPADLTQCQETLALAFPLPPDVQAWQEQSKSIDQATADDVDAPRNEDLCNGEDNFAEIVASDVEIELKGAIHRIEMFLGSLVSSLQAFVQDRLGRERTAAAELLLDLKTSQGAQVLPEFFTSTRAATGAPTVTGTATLAGGGGAGRSFVGRTSVAAFAAAAAVSELESQQQILPTLSGAAQGAAFRNSLSLGNDMRASISGSLNPEEADLASGFAYCSKIDAIIRGLNPLRASASYVRMDPDGENGERAYIFKEQDLNSFLDTLALELLWWDRSKLHSRQQRYSQLSEYLKSRINSVEQATEIEKQGFNVQLELGKAPDRQIKPLATKEEVKSEVADRAMRLTFEVDLLHQTINRLKTVSRELEYRLSNEVHEQVREAASTLTQTVAAESGCYSESQQKRAHEIGQQMRLIREHVTATFAELAAKNHAVQERAKQSRKEAMQNERPPEENEEGMTPARAPASPDKVMVVSDNMHAKLHQVARRDDVRVLRLQLEELANSLICSRFFFLFKRQAMKQRHEQQMQALTMTLESNRELSERLAQATHKHMEGEAELTKQTKNMSVYEKDIEELKTKVESHASDRQRLQMWRRSKVKQMRHIEQTVKEHKLGGTVNADELAATLQSKRDRVHHLETERAQAAADLATLARASEAKTAKVRDALLAQRQEKDAIHYELNRLREAVDQGGMDDDERLQLWHRRAELERLRVTQLQQENQQLRQLLRERKSTLS